MLHLTSEDSWIWGFASYPRDFGNARFARALYGESMESDRRDAELMLKVQTHRYADPVGGDIERYITRSMLDHGATIVKPLPVPPLTRQDGMLMLEVFERIGARWAGRRWDRYAFLCTQADRRDAALLLRAQQFREAGFLGPMEAAPLEPKHCLRWAASDPAAELRHFGGDITWCA